MFSTTLIVFRETLEAALFVGIVAAATRGYVHRGRWLSMGVLAGVLASLMLAGAMSTIASWADGLGQDILNIMVLSAALVMLTWHCVWVSTHAHEVVRHARHLGDALVAGSSTLMALAVAVGLAVLREGAETVLFVTGLTVGAGDQLALTLGSVVLGLATGTAVGCVLYYGLVRVQTKKLFAISNVLIVILAGGIASQLAKALIQVGWISQGSTPLWDGSMILSNESTLGVLLHALIGYEARPAALQVMFYVVAIGFIGLATTQMKLRHGRRRIAMAHA